MTAGSLWPDPAALLREQLDTAGKLLDGAQALARLSPDAAATGVTPKEEIYADGKVRLFRYEPRVAKPFAVPVVIVYAIFNRFYMIDLQEDRSLVRNLLDHGLDLYVMDWGYPDRSDRFLTLDDYVNGYVHDCLDVVRERHGLDKVNVLGICQGGTASLCYTALHPDGVHNLITMVTPVDFDVEGSVLNAWARSLDADALVDALGIVPGDLIALGFMTRSPFQRQLQKYVDLVDILDDEEKLLSFLRMEQWIFDTPAVAGEAFRQWIVDFYQGNKLIKGEVELGGERVDLRRITMPVLNVYAERDDVCPPASAAALERYVGSDDYTARSFPVGHIGMYVSSKMQHQLAPTLAGWLLERG